MEVQVIGSSIVERILVLALERRGFESVCWHISYESLDKLLNLVESQVTHVNRDSPSSCVLSIGETCDDADMCLAESLSELSAQNVTAVTT